MREGGPRKEEKRERKKVNVFVVCLFFFKAYDED